MAENQDHIPANSKYWKAKAFAYDTDYYAEGLAIVRGALEPQTLTFGTASADSNVIDFRGAAGAVLYADAVTGTVSYTAMAAAGLAETPGILLDKDGGTVCTLADVVTGQW